MSLALHGSSVRLAVVQALDFEQLIAPSPSWAPCFDGGRKPSSPPNPRRRGNSGRSVPRRLAWLALLGPKPWRAIITSCRREQSGRLHFDFNVTHPSDPLGGYEDTIRALRVFDCVHGFDWALIAGGVRIHACWPWIEPVGATLSTSTSRFAAAAAAGLLRRAVGPCIPPPPLAGPTALNRVHWALIYPQTFDCQIRALLDCHCFLSPTPLTRFDTHPTAQEDGKLAAAGRRWRGGSGVMGCHPPYSGKERRRSRANGGFFCFGMA